MQVKRKGRYFMTKKINKIPKFTSIKDEAKFWDTHDVTDYLSDLKTVNISVHLAKPKEKQLYFESIKILNEDWNKYPRVKG